MSGPLPPANLDRRLPELVRLPAAGQEVYRFYTAKRQPIFFDRSTEGRFNAPDASYGVLYAAKEINGAFAETFLRTPGHTLIDADLLKRKAYVRLLIGRDLNLIRLAGPGLARVGATAEVAHGGLPYDVPQAWSIALARHPIAPMASPTMPGMMMLNSAMHCSTDRRMLSQSRHARSISIKIGSGGSPSAMGSAGLHRASRSCGTGRSVSVDVSRSSQRRGWARVSEPIEPIRPEEIVDVRRNFAEPIGAPETIARYTGKLVAELCASLEMRGQGHGGSTSVLPCRQPRRGDPCRHSNAGARCEAPDSVAHRQNRDRRSGIRHRADAAGRGRCRAVGGQADDFPRLPRRQKPTSRISSTSSPTASARTASCSFPDCNAL